LVNFIHGAIVKGLLYHGSKSAPYIQEHRATAQNNEDQMTDEESALFVSLENKTGEIEVMGDLILEAVKNGQRLPFSVKDFLRRISEATAECESVIEDFAVSGGPSDEALQQVAASLRKVHQNLGRLIMHAAAIGIS
jgi:hypothetical protein